MLDHEKQILDHQKAIALLKAQNKESGVWSDEEILKLEKSLEQLKEQVYSKLTPWQRVAISRHPARPRSSDYLKQLCPDFRELSGDRLYADDHAIIAGLGSIAGQKFAIIAQEKGCDTDSRLYRNFGMPHPEGYRKALRIMKLAEKFSLPLLSLLDTPGAYPGLAAEERGQGSAIATNLFEMAQLRTPTLILLIGEGCSGGALGMGVGDRIAMLEHAYYSVISPEGCASILWHDASKNDEAASRLKMQAEDLLTFGVIDTIIEEPAGGAHHNPKLVYEGVKRFLAKELQELSSMDLDTLIETRYQKFRKLGAFSHNQYG